MVGHIRTGLAVGSWAVFLLGTWAGTVAAAPEPSREPAAGAQPAQAVKTPEELKAEDILVKYKQDGGIRRQLNALLAENLVRLAKDKLEMGDLRGAMRDFEKAAELDPDSKDAQDGRRRTQGMLGVGSRNVGDILSSYVSIQGVAVTVHRLELNNKFDNARALLDKGQYRDAIEAFSRTESLARYLSPLLDVGEMAQDCASYILKAQSKLEEQRATNADNARRDAERFARQLVDDRRNALEMKTQVLYRQASELFGQRRFEEARKTCTEILLKDPNNAAAQSLRESAFAAAHNEEIDRALKARKVEVERMWNWSRAIEVPQSELVFMLRDKFEEVRSRKAATVFSGEKAEAPAWEAKIREAMNKKISFDFVETPLQDVVSFLSSLTDVTMVLDTDAVRDDPKTITLRVNDMRLESALNWVLKLVGLKYTLKDEAIFVSKPERIIDKATLRMYDVSDLTVDIRNFAGRSQALASDGGGNTIGTGTGGGQGAQAGREFFLGDEEKPEEEKLTGEALVRFIKQTIAIGTWIDDDLAVANK